MTPAPISVERLRELLDKATPGPWSLDQYVDVVGCDDSGVAALVGDNFSNNGPLIVAAVNALPALLQQLAEREAECERLRSFAQDVMDSWPGGDVDGGYLQEVAENRGLLVAVEAIVPCGENCGCAEFYSTGDTANCYRKTTLLTGDSKSDDCIAAFLAASGGARHA